MTGYHGYGLRFLGDSTEPCYLGECVYDNAPMWVCCKVLRVPSQREFRVRFLAGATPSDRGQFEREFRQLPEVFASNERTGNATKRRSQDGTYYWILRLGRPVDDPLMQLELEMMIDLDSGVPLR